MIYIFPLVIYLVTTSYSLLFICKTHLVIFFQEFVVKYLILLLFHQSLFLVTHIVLSDFPQLSFSLSFSPLTAKLFNLNFHPFEIVSR